MAEQTTDTAFELIISESYAREIECESNHKKSICTYKVTSLASSTCGPSFKCCEGSKKAQQDHMAGGNTCARCHKYSRDCWSIRPI